MFDRIKIFSKQDREIQEELNIFLKNYLNPTKEDMEDFIDSLEDRYTISNREQFLNHILEKKKAYKQDQQKRWKLQVFNKAAGHIESDDTILQYKAIRHIYGLSRDNVTLRWMYENHHDVIEDISRKLSGIISNSPDTSIVKEAKLALNLVEYVMNVPKNDSISPLICDNCSNEIRLGWDNCAACGAKIDWVQYCICPQCKQPFYPGMNICPECGIDMELVHCRECGKPVEPFWRLCPFCGINVD